MVGAAPAKIKSRRKGAFIFFRTAVKGQFLKDEKPPDQGGRGGPADKKCCCAPSHLVVAAIATLSVFWLPARRDNP
jgi:hypothetical protein